MDLFHTCFSLTFKLLLFPLCACMNDPAIDLCRRTMPFTISSQMPFILKERKKNQERFNMLRIFISTFLLNLQRTPQVSLFHHRAAIANEGSLNWEKLAAVNVEIMRSLLLILLSTKPSDPLIIIYGKWPLRNDVKETISTSRQLLKPGNS